MSDQLPIVITRRTSINSQQTLGSTLYVCEVLIGASRKMFPRPPVPVDSLVHPILSDQCSTRCVLLDTLLKMTYLKLLIQSLNWK